jgi:monothiol glutaredoxin
MPVEWTDRGAGLVAGEEVPMGIRDRIKRRLPIIGAGGNRGRTEVAPPAAPMPTAAPAAAAEPAPEPHGGRSAREVIDELVKGNKIVLFMKGSPMSPMCGFSATAAGILEGYNKPLAHFNVLSDPEIRSEVKEYSQWPTIPQVYVNGEFLGGSDILRQMHESGELQEVIDEAFAEA